MGKIRLPIKTDDNSGDEGHEMFCPRCGNDSESLGFSTDGDRHCCKRCQMFFSTRHGDLAGHGRHRDSGPAISER